MMSNKTFDTLKWCTMLGIPAFTTFFVTLDSIFGWGLGDTVAQVSAAVCTLLGTLLGISNKMYYKKETSLEMPEDEVEVDNNEVGEG